ANLLSRGVCERHRQGCKLVGVAAFRRNPRRHSDAVEHDVGELAEGQAQSKGRDGEYGWTPDALRQLTCEVRIAKGRRHHRIYGAVDCVIFKSPNNDSCDVVNVHAAHPLMAASKLSAKAHSEDGPDELERAA